MRRRHLVDEGRRPICGYFGHVNLTDDPQDVDCTRCIAILNGSDQVHRAAWQDTYAKASSELRERHRFEFDLIRLELYPAARDEAIERRERMEAYRREHPL